VDVSAFASLLFEIVVGHAPTFPMAAAGESRPSVGVPDFIQRIIEDGRLPESNSSVSFATIVQDLKANRFEIMPGVDSEEVSGFVNWVESAEQSGKWE
jgi:hypothetical protein